MTSSLAITAVIVVARTGRAGGHILVDFLIVSVLLWILTRHYFELSDLREAGVIAGTAAVTGLLALPLEPSLRLFVVLVNHKQHTDHAVCLLSHR